MDKPLPITTILKYNRTLQAYKHQAETNTLSRATRQKLPTTRAGRKLGTPLFMRYPPEVRRRAWEHFSLLCIKHKDKLISKGHRYYCVLVATATRLALADFRLIDTRKGFHRMRIMNWIRWRIGVRDKFPGDRRAVHLANRRGENGSSTSNLP